MRFTVAPRRSTTSDSGRVLGAHARDSHPHLRCEGSQAQVSDAAHHSNPEEVELTEAAENIADCLTRITALFLWYRAPKSRSSLWAPKQMQLASWHTPARRRYERHGVKSAEAVLCYTSALPADAIRARKHDEMRPVIASA